MDGATLEEVARELRLTPAPPDWTEDRGGSSYQATRLAGGWVLLVRRMEGAGIVAESEMLAKLSRGRRVVACDEDSRVMYSAASEWVEGRERWALIHSSEQADDHLAARGDLPGGWTAKRDQSLAEQARAAEGEEAVDRAYEVPLEVARLVVGYRIESEDSDELELVTLLTRSSKPWWRFW